jgi:hypothetical protein
VRATLLVFGTGIIAGNFQLNKIKDEKHTTARALQQQYFIYFTESAIQYAAYSHSMVPARSATCVAKHIHMLIRTRYLFAYCST